ncbi:SSD domain-containing protein [Plasmodiophora brassicae]
MDAALSRWGTLITSSRGRLLVPIACAIVVVVSAYWAARLPDSTEVTFEPPPQSPSAEAEQVIAEAFPSLDRQMVLVVLATSQTPGVTDLQPVQQFHDRLDALVVSMPGVRLTDYFSMSAKRLPQLASRMVTDDGRSTIFLVTYRGEPKRHLVTRRVQALVATASSPVVSFGLTGVDPLIQSIVADATDDLLRTDSVSLPIALVLMAFLIGSVLLLALPLMSLVTTLCVSFSILYALTHVTAISSIVPPISMSLIVALSIDYSLFLLVRFKEEISEGKTSRSAACISLRTAGRAIVTSGLTLAASFGSLCLFRAELLRSLGLSAAVVVVCTVLVNLTLTPALLALIWPTVDHASCAWSMFRRPASNNDTGRIWTRIAKMTTSSKLLALLSSTVVLVVTIPVAVRSSQVVTTIDASQMYPRGTPAYNTLQDLGTRFGAGAISPYRIVQTVPPGASIFGETWWTEAQNLVQSIAFHQICDSKDIGAVSVVPSFGNISSELAQTIIAHPDLLPGDLGRSYAYVFNELVNEKRTATIIELQIAFDPLGDRAASLIADVRSLLVAYEKRGNARYYLTGGAVPILDTIDDVFSHVPHAAVFVALLIVVFLTVEFRSVFVSVRASAGIVLSLCWVFGVAVAVIQSGWLEAHFEAYRGIRALFWLTPVLVAPVVAGLGLDYDIFLMERIAEYRDRGRSHAESIRLAVLKTGSVISGAGLIMAAAFCGLMASRIVSVAQIGFMLTCAVLVDTFVIRAFLVPSLMFLAGQDIAWFPSTVRCSSKAALAIDDDLYTPLTAGA